MGTFWVTGAGAGLGRAVTLALAARGDQVTALDVDEAALHRLEHECDRVRVIQVDMSDTAALEAALDELVRRHERLDGLANCVGVSGRTAPVEEIRLADWRAIMDVNLTSHLVCSAFAARIMKVARGGSIVNVSSTSALTGLPLRTPYVVSKAGVIALTRNLARELGPFGIRANVVVPGPMSGERLVRVIREKAAATGLTEEAYRAEMLRFISMGTLVEPSDVAQMILFLLSDAARTVSGQVIAVDGDLRHEE